MTDAHNPSPWPVTDSLANAIDAAARAREAHTATSCEAAGCPCHDPVPDE